MTNHRQRFVYYFINWFLVAPLIDQSTNIFFHRSDLRGGFLDFCRRLGMAPPLLHASRLASTSSSLFSSVLHNTLDQGDCTPPGSTSTSLSVPLESWLKLRDLVLRSVNGPNLVSLSVPLEPWLESRDLVLRHVIGPNQVSLVSAAGAVARVT